MYREEGESHKTKQVTYNNVSKSVRRKCKMLIGSHFIANQKPNQCPIIDLSELFAVNNLFNLI